MTGLNLRDGDKVTIYSVVGMTELNTNTYYVKKLMLMMYNCTVILLLRNTVDGTGFTAYTSGGTGTTATGSSA